MESRLIRCALVLSHPGLDVATKTATSAFDGGHFTQQLVVRNISAIYPRTFAVNVKSLSAWDVLQLFTFARPQEKCTDQTSHCASYTILPIKVRLHVRLTVSARGEMKPI